MTSPDDELLPSVAPRGSRITYAAKAGGNLDIYVRPLEGGSPTRLTKHSTDDSDPAFSPNGKKIAWVAQKGDVKGDLWVMDRDGDDKRRITDRETADSAPAWSADGKRLFFTTSEPGVLESRIDSIHVESGERRTVVERGWDAVPAPDGKHLFFVALDKDTPRIFVKRLGSDEKRALTDGAYPEGLPRATRLADKTVVVFARFLDDRTGDGVVDGADPASLWSVEFDPKSDTQKPPRPLTSNEGSEIFGSVDGGFLAYTTSGFTDLDVYALPAGGIIDEGASADAVLSAAASQANPALRRLAYRYIISTTGRRVADARYALARELAEQGKYAEAGGELERAVEDATSDEQRVIIRLERQRLAMLERLGGKLLAREDAARTAITNTLMRVAEISSEAPDSVTVKTRVETIGAEASYALGNRSGAVETFEDVAARASAPQEDAARSLDRLGMIYDDMSLPAAVRRVSATLVRDFGDVSQTLINTSSARWVDGAADLESRNPLGALEDIASTYRALAPVAARAEFRLAKAQAQTDHPDVAIRQWQSLVQKFPDQRAIVSDALLSIAEVALRLDDPDTARDALRRLLAEYASSPKDRAKAQRGLTQLAFSQARSKEFKAQNAKSLDVRKKWLEGARESYRTLIRNNRERVLAHRRFIALSAELGHLDEVLEQYRKDSESMPRDRIARYGFAYALTYKSPPDLESAEESLLTALELDPRFAAAQLTMGWLRLQYEREEPNEGWLERAIDSFSTARGLVDADAEPEIHAAVELNLGNALLALGKTDAAFASYLQRELSTAPFIDFRTELLFRESFARVAMGEGEYDLALDQALLGYRLSGRMPGNPRLATTAALVASTYLMSSDYVRAEVWFERSRSIYEERSQWEQVVPMLRGRALSERALGKLDAAEVSLKRILELLAEEKGPEQPEPPGLQGLVTELPADSKDITRAVYGFSARQERQIAETLLLRVQRERGTLTLAEERNVERLRLLESEAKDTEPADRLHPELAAARYEAGRLALARGDLKGALDNWLESLEFCETMGAWSNAEVVLDSMQRLWLANPRERRTPMIQRALEVAHAGLAATSTEQPEVAQRLARFVSLHHLTQAVQPPVPHPLFAMQGQTPANNPRSLSAQLEQLEQRLESGALAESFALLSQDRSLLRDVRKAAGISSPTERVFARATRTDEAANEGWRDHFSSFLTSPRADRDARLQAAITAYRSEPRPESAPEECAFVEAAAKFLVSKDDVEGARSLWERYRLLQLRPPIELLRQAEVWPSLKPLLSAREPDAFAKTLASSSSLARALAGHPASLAEVQKALEGRAGMVQRFAGPGSVAHWFGVTPTGNVAYAESPLDAQGIPEAVQKAWGDEAPEVLYASTDIPLISAASKEVSHVLSATYLVAARTMRNLARKGRVSLSATGGTPGSLLVELHVPLKVYPPPLGPRGETKVAFQYGADVPPPERLNHGRLFREKHTATAGWVSQVPWEAQGMVSQALLLAGIPTLVQTEVKQQPTTAFVEGLLEKRVTTLAAGQSSWRTWGYAGMDFETRTVFAEEEYIRNAGVAIRNYRAKKWIASRDGFLDVLDVVDFMQRPEVTELMKASENKRTQIIIGKLEQNALSLRNRLAEVYQLLGSPAQAAEIQEGLLASERSAGNDARVAQLSLELGKTYTNAKQPESSSKALERCARLAEETKNILLRADCLSRLGSARRQLLDYEGAIRAYQESMLLYASQNHPNEWAPRRYLGFLYESSLSKYQRAAEQFRASLMVAQRHGRKDLVPQIRIDIARVARQRGNYDAALEQVKEALQEMPPERRAEAELEAARIYWYRGNYQRALERQERSLQLAREQADTYREIQALSLAGLIALRRGELEAAETSIRDALLLSRADDRASEEAIQRNNLGIVLLEEGRPEEALEQFRGALAIDEKLGSVQGRAYDLRWIAAVEHEQEQEQKALETIEESLRLSREVGNTFNELYGLLLRGDILESLGKDESSSSYSAAVDLAQKIAVAEVEWQALYALGRQDRRDGNVKEARQRLDAALQVAERLGRGRSSGASEFSRDALYAAAIELAVDAEDHAATFGYMERARARATLDAIATASISLPDERASELIRAEAATRDSLLRAERERRTGENDQAAVGAAEDAHRAAQAKLEVEYPHLARLMTIDPVSLEEIQDALPAESLLVEYYVGPKRTTVLTIGPSKVRSTSVSIERATLVELSNLTRRKLEAFADVESELAQLGELFIGPVEEELMAAKSVIFAAHGPLHSIPFAALPLAGAPLLESVSVSYTPRGGTLFDRLASPAQPSPNAVAALAFGPDLPFAHLEVQSVGTTVLTAGDATEASLRELRAESWDLAVHGYLDPKDPMASHLALAQGPKDDGRLRLSEVIGLPNVPPLVTLSSCSTAGADPTGDAWMSLGNAFLAAGASSVVASLHRVSDLATAVMVKRFYRFRRSMGTAEALREAALWTRKRFPHPAHWAALSLWGDFR